MDLPMCLNRLPFSGGQFLIRTMWGPSHIELSIHYSISNKSFKGTLSRDEMMEAARELEITFEDFNKECRDALTTHMGLPAFQYDLDCRHAKLLLIKKDTVTIIKYLDIQLKEDSDIASKMLETAVDIINEQNQSNSELQLQKTKLQESYRETCDAYERSLQEKNTMESKLLKKFSLLLNSKKAKIEELLMEREARINDEDRDFDDFELEDLDREPSTSAIAKERENGTNKNTLETSTDDDDCDYNSSTQLMTF